MKLSSALLEHAVDTLESEQPFVKTSNGSVKEPDDCVQVMRAAWFHRAKFDARWKRLRDCMEDERADDLVDAFWVIGEACSSKHAHEIQEFLELFASRAFGRVHETWIKQALAIAEEAKRARIAGHSSETRRKHGDFSGA